jgi:hypothetical protein
MELSNFLAQLFGLTIAIFAGIAILQPGLIRAVVKEFGESVMVTLFVGLVGIMGGLAVILSHNLWVADWRVLITLLGWAALVKGIVSLVSPDMLRDMGMSMYSSPQRIRIMLVITGVLGVYLSGAGFGLL